jgi:hypothetical protein
MPPTSKKNRFCKLALRKAHANPVVVSGENVKVTFSNVKELGMV